jgi:hypothetical protein
MLTRPSSVLAVTEIAPLDAFSRSSAPQMKRTCAEIHFSATLGEESEIGWGSGVAVRRS